MILTQDLMQTDVYGANDCDFVEMVKHIIPAVICVLKSYFENPN